MNQPKISWIEINVTLIMTGLIALVIYMYHKQFPVILTLIPWLINLAVALAIMIFIRITINTLTPMVYDACRRHNIDHHTSHILAKTIQYVLTIFGATIALQNMGIKVSMLIAAFGITGIVLSYGMKDIVANFIASILILGYKHIKIGDYIRIKDWEGTVVDINLRYTTLVDGEITTYIPNIKLYTEPLAIIKKS